jgi:hypothetical protein
MSVIFKTLKKLKAQSSEKIKDAEKRRLKKKVSFFREIFTSSRTIIFLVIFILFSGLISIHLVNVAKEKRQKSVQIAEKRQVVTGTIDRKADSVPEEKKAVEEIDVSIPPPPESIPSEKAEIGKLYLPRKTKAPVKQTEATSETAFPSSSIPSLNAVPSEETPSVILPETAATPEKVSEKPGNTEFAQYLPPAGKDAGEKSFQAAIPPPSEILDDRTAEAIAEASERRLQRIRVQKNIKIGTIIGKIQKNIKAHDTGKTEKLIDQLASIKGKNDQYVLKLRAFHLMNQGDFKSAVSLLNRVLETDKDDREAGINMAILEMKNGQVNKAKSRLYRLRDIHPHDTLIPDLINKIE